MSTFCFQVDFILIHLLWQTLMLQLLFVSLLQLLQIKILLTVYSQLQYNLFKFYLLSRFKEDEYSYPLSA